MIYYISASACSNLLDIVLILDESTSIVYYGGYEAWDVHIKGFVNHLIDYFDISPSTTQVGAVEFSEVARLAFYMNRYGDKASLESAVEELTLNGGETNIASALRLARTQVLSPQNGARLGVRRVVVLITDGEANREIGSTFAEADLLKNSNAEIFVIGISDRVNEVELRQIATQPASSHYFFVSDFNALDAIVNSLATGSCGVTTLATPTVPDETLIGAGSLTPPTFHGHINTTSAISETTSPIPVTTTTTNIRTATTTSFLSTPSMHDITSTYGIR